MLRPAVDVVNVEEAIIAEAAGACAVMVRWCSSRKLSDPAELTNPHVSLCTNRPSSVSRPTFAGTEALRA